MKELFETIPTLEDLCSLGMEKLRADIILVDAEKDKKLTMLKHLSAALVKGANSNPASLIKKLAGLVYIYALYLFIFIFIPAILHNIVCSERAESNI